MPRLHSGDSPDEHCHFNVQASPSARGYVRTHGRLAEQPMRTVDLRGASLDARATWQANAKERLQEFLQRIAAIQEEENVCLPAVTCP